MMTIIIPCGAAVVDLMTLFMPLLLEAYKVTVDCKVGLGSSWWNTAQDFSQVNGKWILLTLLFSVCEACGEKKLLSQSHIEQQGVHKVYVANLSMKCIH